MTEQVITREALVKAINAQTKSADLWISQYREYRDGSSVKNVLFVLGKLYGIIAMYNVLAPVEEYPSEVQAVISKYGPIYHEVMQQSFLNRVV